MNFVGELYKTIQETEFICVYQYRSSKEILTRIAFTDDHEDTTDTLRSELLEEESLELLAIAEVINAGEVEMWMHREFVRKKTRPKLPNEQRTGPDEFFKLTVADKRKILTYVTFRNIMYLCLLYGIIGIPILAILILLALSASS